MNSFRYLLIVAMSLTVSINTSNAQHVDAQMQKSYNALIQEHEDLTIQIESLVQQLGTVKRSKAKKLNKEILILQTRADAAERLIASYPRSLTDPTLAKQLEDQETDKLRQEMADRLDEKLATIDVDKEALEDVTDGEIRRAYENYQKYGDVSAAAAAPASKMQYSVQIGAGKSGAAASFRNAKNVKELPLNNGKSLYCSGGYGTREEAGVACSQLRRYYRDAFVIGISGNKKVKSF